MNSYISKYFQENKFGTILYTTALKHIAAFLTAMAMRGYRGKMVDVAASCGAHRRNFNVLLTGLFSRWGIFSPVSISEANQNFSRVARLVDERGTAVILKNNAPRYVLLGYGLFRKNTSADDESVDAAAMRILAKHIRAFEELAK